VHTTDNNIVEFVNGDIEDITALRAWRDMLVAVRD
jgi:hypothetical protein